MWLSIVLLPPPLLLLQLLLLLLSAAAAAATMLEWLMRVCPNCFDLSNFQANCLAAA